MDIELARKACYLADRVDWLRSLHREMDVAATDERGSVTVKIPRTWLPALMEMAEKEISELEKQIQEL